MSLVNAEEIKKVLKNKDWETYVVNNENGKICFAQSVPILQDPKKDSRDRELALKEYYNLSLLIPLTLY